jgi:hypothetical protein
MRMRNDAPTRTSASSAGYETADANPRNIFLVVSSLVVVGVVSVVALAGLFRSFEHQAVLRDQQLEQSQSSHVVIANQPYFPFPREQPSPADELKAFQAQASAELNSYGWIDRKGGVVRIPISRAMELIAERGLPTRASNHVALGPSDFQLQQDRVRNGTNFNEEVR